MAKDPKELVREPVNRIQQRLEQRDAKTVDKSMIVLIVLGLLVNIGGSKLALALNIPIFLDCIGTVGAAVLGGALPGIIVGFLTNLINGISDPITMYYGILSVILAAAAAFLSKRRMFSTFGRTMVCMLVFSVIGGALGSILTWLLYGFDAGVGISAPLAHFLNSNLSFSEFAAQISADMAIDLADKLVTVIIIFFLLKLLPDKWLNKTYLGRLYSREGAAEAAVQQAKKQYRKRSLKVKVPLLIVFTAVVIGVCAIAISYAIYSAELMERFIDTSRTGAKLVGDVVEGDDIEKYLENGGTSAKYKSTNNNLKKIYESVPDIDYLYVYKIEEDGLRVVFDVDTPELSGGKCGELIPYGAELEPYREQLLSGQTIEPITTQDDDGHLLTVLEPIIDSQGSCAAYACVDVSMDGVISARVIFIIKLLSLLFGVSILAVVFAIWYAERRMVEPINAMTVASGKFAYDSDVKRVDSVREFDALDIDTGDEIETLYKAITKTVSDVAGYIGLVQEKAETITRLQDSMILSFADMVENRDENTGEHIKHTARYVDVIARELQKEGKFPGQLTDKRIEVMVRSAPLHDIGKVKISDIILNKPGKLTDEEFALMKTHTTAGRDILRGVTENLGEEDSYLATAVEMAAYHHEWWNGRGYPDGLVGEAIPLSARIMAVADVFDALVSKRSYKEPFTPEKARETIVEESGSHFDPQVVEAFVNAWNEIEAVRREEA